MRSTLNRLRCVNQQSLGVASLKSSRQNTWHCGLSQVWSNHHRFSSSAPDSLDSNDKYSEYRQPLITRYASKDMRRVWSEREKFATWRKLWVALAKAQMELDVPGITEPMINEMEANIYNIDFDFAQKKERELRHDVMAHIHTFAECLKHYNPDASKIIHLGATSCYVQDNGDLYLMQQSCHIILCKLLRVIEVMKEFSLEYAEMACLGYTHLQPAQLTTVGKRGSLWMQDFYFDFMNLSSVVANNLILRGAKGTTGSQASFLKIFNGDGDKVDEMERKIVEYLGCKNMNKVDSVSSNNENGVLYLTGQTYTRKIDFLLISALSGIAQTAHKFATDIRLLSSFGEMEEPFEPLQIGSSAMAYKRNPMRSERACALARYLKNLETNTSDTHSVQWLERSLDDSANRRMVLPEAFLCCDAILDLCLNIMSGINVYESIITKRINEELVFMATENILMQSVKKGGNRQELHEVIRQYALAAVKEYKEGSKNKNFNKSEKLLQDLKQDAQFEKYLSNEEIDRIVGEPKEFIGRAPEQVRRFVHEVVDPLLERNISLLNDDTVHGGSVHV